MCAMIVIEFVKKIGELYMKLIKIIAVFFITIIIFSSCETLKLRNMHNREIRTVLDKYSNVLYLEKTNIAFAGRRYYLMGSEPRFILSLYLKPNQNNRETVTEIRDDLITFFKNNNWETRGKYQYPHSITVEFFIVEHNETKTFCWIAYDSWCEWFEKWYNDIFAKPLTGNINNKNLDMLLYRYYSDIEEFVAYRATPNDTRQGVWWANVNLLVNNRDIIPVIGDELVAFFDNFQQELEEEDMFSDIWIVFYIMKNETLTVVYSINYQEYRRYPKFERNSWSEPEWH
jgi:hypothetical protein